MQFIELERRSYLKRSILKKLIEPFRDCKRKVEEIEAHYTMEEGKKAEREKLTESLIRLNDHLPAVAELASKKRHLT